MARLFLNGYLRKNVQFGFTGLSIMLMNAKKTMCWCLANRRGVLNRSYGEKLMKKKLKDVLPQVH